MSSLLVADWQASPARGLSRPEDSTSSCWKRATAWEAGSTASTWTASMELGAQWVHDDAASHPARKFCERANLKLRGTSWEQAALVSRGERRPGAEIKRARAPAAGVRRQRTRRRTRSPTRRWTTRSGRCSRAPTR